MREATVGMPAHQHPGSRPLRSTWPASCPFTLLQRSGSSPAIPYAPYQSAPEHPR